MVGVVTSATGTLPVTFRGGGGLAPPPGATVERIKNWPGSEAAEPEGPSSGLLLLGGQRADGSWWYELAGYGDGPNQDGCWLIYGGSFDEGDSVRLSSGLRLPKAPGFEIRDDRCSLPTEGSYARALQQLADCMVGDIRARGLTAATCVIRWPPAGWKRAVDGGADTLPAVNALDRVVSAYWRSGTGTCPNGCAPHPSLAALSSVTDVSNALRLRRFPPPAIGTPSVAAGSHPAAARG